MPSAKDTKFSRVIDWYFHQWIDKESWNSQHPTDMERFYTFVKAVCLYAKKGKLPPPPTLRRLIMEHGHLFEGSLEGAAEYFTGQYTQLLDFHSAPRPKNFDLIRHRRSSE